jgi:hypothetical protein
MQARFFAWKVGMPRRFKDIYFSGFPLHFIGDCPFLFSPLPSPKKTPQAMTLCFISEDFDVHTGEMLGNSLRP